jgi:hypothetical protein
VEILAWQLATIGMALELGGLLFLFGDLFLAKRAAGYLKNIQMIDSRRSEVRLEFLWGVSNGVSGVGSLVEHNRELTESESTELHQLWELIEGGLEAERERDAEAAERLKELHELFDQLVFKIEAFAVVGASFVLLGTAMQLASAFMHGPG